jgi:glycine/D-amino acid oxidase-like deaminating enzyme
MWRTPSRPPRRRRRRLRSDADTKIAKAAGAAEMTASDAAYSGISFWLETCGDDLAHRPAFRGDVEADCAILGAGYSGLWTAYYLLKREPSLRVVLSDAEISGFGASGRNGGWVSSGFPVTVGRLVRRFGTQPARAMLQAVSTSIDEIDRVLRQEKIEAEFVKGGALRIARGAAQVPAIENAFEAYAHLGLGDRYALLDRAAVDARIRVPNAQGALFTRDCALMHPGKLVRGLARVVEGMGATIFERSPITRFEGNPTPRLLGSGGTIRARTIILAGEAYLTRLRPLHRVLLPVYSSIVLTEPLTDEMWSEIGWAGREAVSSNRLTVDYLSRTADDRILFGSRGAPYHFGSRIDAEFDHDTGVSQSISDMLFDWFPMLRGRVNVTHAWAGPVGMPRDWMPTASFNPRTGIATARGYTGQGVAISNLAGRILADLITGVESDVTRVPMANHHSRSWEPEPLRWLAVRYIQNRLERFDARGARTGQPSNGTSLAERLARH